MPDPIVTDDDGKPEDQPEEQLKTKHQTDYDALVARRQAEQAKPIAEPETKTEDPPKQDEPTIDLIDANGNTVKVPASAKYRAKIDGAEVEVPFEQVARSYQVGAAADKRLRDASDRQKALEAKERDLETRGAELSKKEQAYLDQMRSIEAKKDAGKLSDDAYRDRAKKLLEAFDAEDPEAAMVEALKGITPSQDAIDAEKIAARAKQEAVAEIDRREKERAEKDRQAKAAALEKERLEANQRFESEYKDIIEDPVAFSAASNLANKKWAERPDAKPWEIANEVGTEIRSWKKSLMPETSEKKRPPVTPRSVSGRATIGKDPVPVTRESILADMKKARGQPV